MQATSALSINSASAMMVASISARVFSLSAFLSSAASSMAALIFFKI
jgi:hypothetical protein